MKRAYSYLRFSTPEQIKGDSFRRQAEASQQYAEKHGLKLDYTLNLQDLGISAFRGSNIEHGALGAFLKAVDQGKVKKGSYLLVESLDRLSRQNTFEAFQLFSSILTRGINIVTLQDNKEYSASQGEVGFGDLMLSLATMQRAHEESLTKSKRLAAAWKAKRENAGNKKLTATCPAWLELNRESQAFNVIEARAKVVNRIYQMKLEGMGNYSISRKLNAESVPTFTGSTAWYMSYIRRILKNEAVIGNFQPHSNKIVNGKRKRIPQGEPIENYYPPIVDKATFYKVQQMKKEGVIPPGKASVSFSNILTGLAFCGNCGARMHFENKGRGPKGGSYLVCSMARRKAGNCKRLSWKYPQTQAHIILNLNELDFRELLPDVYQKSQEAVESLEDVILVKQAELDDTIKALDNVVDAIADRSKSSTLLNKLDTLEVKKEQLESEMETLKANLEHEREHSREASQKYEEISEALKKYIEIEREGNQKNIYDARRRLHQLLKSVIKWIGFYPPKESHLHGIITIIFQGVDDKYYRQIDVEKGQKNSQGYKVSAGESTLQVAVVDAQFPPVDRIVSGAFLEKEILGK